MAPRSTSQVARASGHKRVGVAGVSISHPERVFFPGEGVTKLELARYYEAVAPWMVPHVRGRPLTLVRCAETIADCAYMRHLRAWRHWPALRVVEVPEQKKVGEYMVADNAAALVSLLQMDVLEVHTWNSTDAHLEAPDRIVIDLDPDERLPWPVVVTAAQLVRLRLEERGLRSWVKTTGGKGLHVVAPLVPRADWDACLTFARDFGRELEKAEPRAFSASVAKAARAGKIFVDYLRNGRGNSSVAAYSVRARQGAPVSAPLTWEELEGRRRPVFDVRTMLTRLRAQAVDPWRDYFETRQWLPGARPRRATTPPRPPRSQPRPPLHRRSPPR
jgi:bifunctional non-homologous end joining protein LigD